MFKFEVKYSRKTGRCQEPFQGEKCRFVKHICAKKGIQIKYLNILIAVGHTAALSYFIKRRTVKQDTQPVSVNFGQLETLLGKDDCCFSEVASLQIFTVVVYICFPPSLIK